MTVVTMEDFKLLKNVFACCATVLCIISTCLVSFKISLKNQTAPVRISEVIKKYIFICGWFGAFELLPVAGKQQYDMM